MGKGMEIFMEKLGILTCLHSNDVCARVGCLSAFSEKTDFFRGYPENTRLAAMMTCNGCKEERSAEPEEDEGIREKIDRLKSENVTKVHVGVCRMLSRDVECARMTKICQLLEADGIQVIRGTHRE